VKVLILIVILYDDCLLIMNGKVLRRSESLNSVAFKEVSILRALHSTPCPPRSSATPDYCVDSRSYIVSLIQDFEFLGHHCIVLERVYTSLR
jgi:hypothetical protein